MNTRVFSLFLAIVTMVTFFGFVSQPVAAATITVTTTDDELDAGYATDCDPGSESDCSLREAIELSNENGEDDTIELAAAEYVIDLTSTDENNNADGDLDITEDSTTITIEGQGADSTIINGNSDGRVFHTRGSDSTVSMSDLSITGGQDSSGAAILISQGTTLTLNSSKIYSNAVVSGSAYSGGALLVTGDATITDTEVYSNTSDVGGPGIVHSAPGGVLTIDSVLLYDNTAEGTSGALVVTGNADANTVYVTNTSIVDNSTSGIRQFSASPSQVSTLNIAHSTIANNSEYGIRVTRNTINVRNSILSGNTSNECTIGTFGVVTSQGYNIDLGASCGFDEETDMESTDAELDDTLVTNGGAVRTYTIGGDSPAVDAVPSGSCLDAEDNTMTDDIRGLSRPENDDCDIGAYELDQTGATVVLDPSSLTLECAAESWSAPTVSSVTDNIDTTVTTASFESSDVDEDVVGSYNAVYASTADYDGNVGRSSQAVMVEDTTVPTINVTGDTEVSAEAGETYTDAGATATDTCDDSVSVSTSGSVDTDSLGEYTLTYSANDASDNSATQKTRTVTVEDTTAPTLTLSGESAVTITVGDSYSDDGATATDSFEGDLTDDITTSGSVDTDAAGEYTITYNVSDSSGNAATQVTRTVTVEEAEDEGGEEGDSEDPVNDPDSGEGDGTDDTEETLGGVVSLTKSTDSTVTVEYENGSTKTFQLFNASAKAKVQLHTNGEILIAINKTYIRTFDAFTGEQLDQSKLFKNKQYKTKFKRFNVYKNVPGKNNVMVLAQTKKKHKKQFKLRSFVVKNKGKITQRPYRTIKLNNNAKFANLSIAKNKKNGKNARILIKKKGKTLKNWKYRVTKKKGILKKAV